MSVVVTFALAERSVEVFKTAVFRFIELKLPLESDELVVRTANGPGRNWVHAELEFSNQDLATEFNQFLGRVKLEPPPPA